MAIFTDSKEAPGGMMPEGVIETSWDNTEPLITPEKLRRHHLFGIPLVSAIKNPMTNRPDVLDDPLLKEYIIEAVSLAETEMGLQIFNRQLSERQPYDRPAQDSFGFMVLRQRPILSIQELSITSSDGVNIWNVPLDWIDTGYLHSGQINILPFAISAQSGTTIPITSPVGQGLLPSLFKFNWVPGLWQVKYTTGFKNGMVPRSVNQLIGVIAAMEVLSQLASTYSRSNSSSLSIDGLSQSISTPGPELFKVRLDELGLKRKWLTKKLQRLFGLGLWSDNV